MANAEFQNITAYRRITAGSVQTAENVRISVKNDIAEVYSVGVENVINSYDVRDGEVTFYGKTAIKFLYNDGSSVVGSTYSADFTATVANEELTPNSKCCFDVTTVDSNTETNANVATIGILLEVTAYAFVSDEVVCFVDSDDSFVKKEGIELLKDAGVANIPVTVEEQLAANKTIDTVCLAESTLCVTDYTLSEGILHVRGDAAVRLTYLSEGNLTCDVLPFKFHVESEASNIPSNAQLALRPYVRGTKVRLDIAEDSVNTDFSVEISATLCVEWCAVGVTEVVADAYGVGWNFAFTRQNLATTLPCGSTSAQKKVVGNLPADGGKSVAATLNTGATVVKCTSLDKSAKIEGIIFATAVYQTDSGLQSEQIELPFVQSVDIDYLAPQCESFAHVAVENFVLRQNGASAEAELCISVDSFRTVDYSLITSAEEETFDKSRLPALEVCLAHKGETLWTLAKNLHMSEEDLLAVNPEISDPLERDARIVVFNKI